jgi:hypothetical protein
MAHNYEASGRAEPTDLVWSTEESEVLVDLTKDDDAMPQVKEE